MKQHVIPFHNQQEYEEIKAKALQYNMKIASYILIKLGFEPYNDNDKRMYNFLKKHNIIID